MPCKVHFWNEPPPCKPDEGNKIGGYDVVLSTPDPDEDSVLIFKDNEWKDFPKQTLVDGGNF